MLYGFSLCGIRRPAILQKEHLEDARLAIGLMLSRMGQQHAEPVDRRSGGTDAGRWHGRICGRRQHGDDPRRLHPHRHRRQPDRPHHLADLARTEYASMPNKELQAPPTVYWFNRQLSPTITPW